MGLDRMSTDNPLVIRLKELEAEALAAVAEAGDGEALEGVRVTYLGRKDGRISAILRQVGEIDASDRRAVGAEANRVKETLTGALAARSAEVSQETGSDVEAADLTLPGRHSWPGGAHPVNQVVDEISELRDLCAKEAPDLKRGARILSAALEAERAALGSLQQVLDAR